MHKIKIVYFILCLLLNAAAATSCIDPTDKETVEEGLPAQLHLSLLHQDNIVISRATSPAGIENKINNLFVFIFDGTTGKTIFAKFYDKPGTSLTINTTTGNNRRIYGIANIDLGLMSTTATMLQSVSSEDQLKAFAPSLLQEIIARGSSFMMFGFGAPTSDTTEPTAAKDITIAANTSAKIWLNRLDAKITFKVTTATGAIFTPKEWRVLRVPNTTELVPSAATTMDKFSADDANYFDSEWANFEGTGTDMGKTFSFYMLESKVSELKSITGTGTPDALYALREKQEKVPVTPNNPANLPGQTVTNGAFEYARKNATYVQIKGHLTYEHTETSGQKSTISADVTYTIHLGYLNNKLDDYTSLRNTHYTYTIKVQSAASIIVEVENGKESQPGAEGDVAYATQLHAVDANNEITSVTFNKNAIADNITWDVKTPFSKGTQKEHPKDFDWVKFSLNNKDTSSKVYTDDFIPYPGDSRYTAGPVNYATYCNATSKPLLDVDQLVFILKAAKADPSSPLFDTKGDIKFTAYINEYYYTKDPRTNATDDVTLWKSFVNQPDRVLNIVTGSKYSSDGGSMVSNAIQSFRQSSIQTVYNVNSPTLRTAWGSEMTQDDIIAGQELGNFPTTSSPSDGRANTLTLWGITASPAKQWSDFIDQAKWKQITSTTPLPVKPKLVNACMLKNRDKNGNGIIDKEEVVWYLASLNQLTDIWIGESSLSLPTKLYTKTWTANKDNIWHISSTVNSVNNPMLIWSMEGSSTGSANGTESPKEAGYMYRCVRNLGTTDDTAPQELIKYNSTTREMDLSNLNPKSIRAYTQQAELQPHHERSAENMPWKKFAIYATVSGNNYSWTTLNEAVNTGSSPCASINDGNKWRVPNQRELAIMLSRMSDIKGVVSCTSYSFSAVSNKPGFSVANTGFMTVASGTMGGTRCVRDLP